MKNSATILCLPIDFYACALAMCLSLENDLFKTFEFRLTYLHILDVLKTSTSANISMMSFDNLVGFG